MTTLILDLPEITTTTVNDWLILENASVTGRLKLSTFFNQVAVTGGTINGTVIGGTTPAAVTATTLSATNTGATSITTAGFGVATKGWHVDGFGISDTAFRARADSVNFIEFGSFGSGAARGGFARLRDSGDTVRILLDARTDSSARHSYVNGGGAFIVGATAPVGSEKLHIAGGSAPGDPSSTGFSIGAGIARAGTSLRADGNGSAAAPALRIGGEAHGLFRAAATQIGIAVAGVESARLDAPSTGFGGSLRLALPVSGDATLLYVGGTTGFLAVTGGTGTANSGQIRVYGSTHATKADRTEILRGNTISASFDGSGVFALAGTADGIFVCPGKIKAKVDVPASFADLAAVQSYLASIIVPA